jgi:hypothetical protein
LAILLVFILVRFWPVLIAVVVSCVIFEVIARKAGDLAPANLV